MTASKTPRRSKQASETARPAERSLLDVLLGVPLYIKIVAASAGGSALAFGLGWIGSGLAGRTSAGNPLATALLLGATGTVLVALVIGSIVRVALAPLRQLESVAERVERGDTEARVEPSRLADRDISRLTLSFNRALDRQSHYRERLRELALRGLRAHDRSSRQVAIELREGPGQRLASLLLQLRAARMNGGSEIVAGLVEEARSEIVTVLDILARHGEDRAERLVEDLGITGAVEWKVRQLACERDLDVGTAIEVVDPLLTRLCRRTLFEVVQEALENVALHAGTRRASVGIAREGDLVVAEIADDGLGFDPDQMDARGLGLLELEEKVGDVGGRLEIMSIPGGGMRLRAEIPVRAVEPTPSSGRGKSNAGAAG